MNKAFSLRVGLSTSVILTSAFASILFACESTAVHPGGTSSDAGGVADTTRTASSSGSGGGGSDGAASEGAADTTSGTGGGCSDDRCLVRMGAAGEAGADGNSGSGGGCTDDGCGARTGAGGTGVGGTGVGGTGVGGTGVGGTGVGGEAGAGANGGSEDDCSSDAECSDAAPDTDPANCAVGICDSASKKCTFLAKDADGDGVVAANCRSLDGTDVEVGLDCDDTNENIYPGVANESCNNEDDDCDGEVDEDIAPDTTLPCVRPLGAIVENQCREEGFATCSKGRWDGCSVTGKTTTATNDAPFCDSVDYDCNNTLLDACGCTSGDIKDCQTSPLGCSGTSECIHGSWDTCVATNPAACKCTNGDTQTCVGPLNCPGHQSCSGNQWGACACDDPTWECAPGDTRACPDSPCAATQNCDGHWLSCVKEMTCHPSFGCLQTQAGDTQGAVTIGEGTGCFGSCSGADPDGQIGGGQWYSGPLPPSDSGGSVGGTVRAEYAGGGCFSTGDEVALRIECYAALAGCAEPPGGWYAPGNYLGIVSFNQDEVTVPGFGASSTTKNLPRTDLPDRTVCCDTYRGSAEWTPECQGCCERRVVFDWDATAPLACY